MVASSATRYRFSLLIFTVCASKLPVRRRKTVSSCSSAFVFFASPPSLIHRTPPAGARAPNAPQISRSSRAAVTRSGKEEEHDVAGRTIKDRVVAHPVLPAATRATALARTPPLADIFWVSR
jgi:hypothetical protein